MPPSSTSKLTIRGYPKFVNGNVSGSAVATFTLQLNPEQFTVGHELSVDTSGEDEPAAASGVPVADRSRAYNRQTVTLEFLIDNSGALPSPPQGLTAGSSIKTAIDTLRKATIKPTRDAHMPPYVHVSWGNSLSIKGKTTDLSITYQRFNRSGDPIRAKVVLSVIEEVDERVISREFQSPDITRMPTIREGDTLVAMCEEFYGDAGHFLQVAALNDLPSFRRLKVGSVIRFPPLEK
jgi:hypothetical protein